MYQELQNCQCSDQKMRSLTSSTRTSDSQFASFSSVDPQSSEMMIYSPQTQSERIPISPVSVADVLKPKRSVYFSPSSQVTLIPYSTQEEIDVRWYSKEERATLERIFALSVGHMAIKRTQKPLHQFNPEELFECVGMESRMTLDMLELTHQTKRTHVRTIVAAQARQAALDVSDEEELARLSCKGSRQTCERARRAGRYWFMQKEER